MFSKVAFSFNFMTLFLLYKFLLYAQAKNLRGRSQNDEFCVDGKACIVLQHVQYLNSTF